MMSYVKYVWNEHGFAIKWGIITGIIAIGLELVILKVLVI